MGLLADASAALRRCVDGTSVGDAFGQRFFVPELEALSHIATREPPPPLWPFTDDTVMTVAVASVLADHGEIDSDRLAALLGALYEQHPGRGYGGTAHGILRAFANGEDWRVVAGRVFDGMGSMGNGAAMRAAPIGVHFAGDADAAAENARRSAVVTHAHPEGQCGAIAVAIAAALVAGAARDDGTIDGADLLARVSAALPASETRDGLEHARTVPFAMSGRSAASILGNGSRLCAQDTVPFAIWAAAGHLDDYAEALWTTVAGLGDRDTTCAIVGGIVMSGAPDQGIPAPWLAAREPLDVLSIGLRDS